MKNILYLSVLFIIIGCRPATTSEQPVPTKTNVKDELIEVTWLTNFEAAQKLAKEKNLPILADFTGSDWCKWCIRLDHEVFSKNEFKKYAKNNLVLLMVDFPSKKNQPQAEKDQNIVLEQKYGVQGYPTVLLLDTEGKETARTGYKRGGASVYVYHLKELLKK